MRYLLTFLAIIIAAIATWGGTTLASREGGGAGFSGTYPVDVNVQDDQCEHDPFIGMPENITLTVAENQGNVNITSNASQWVPVQGAIDDAGNFEAAGQGTVAGFPNTVVTFVGQIEGNVITGKYSMGDSQNPPGQGGLPPCDDDSNPDTPPRPHPAVYEIKPKPQTPTPTGTPPKLYSILVLKLDEDSNIPLEGWEFNLFFGAGCNGIPFDSGFTDEDGLLDFLGLDQGVYSVEEKPQAGWNNVTDLCQDVTVPDSASGAAGLPPCPIQPDEPFPEAGCDSFGSAARVKYQVNGSDVVQTVNLGGPTLIVRHNAPHKAGGFDEVDTEIIAMELTSTSGLQMTVRESPTRASSGKIIEKENTGPNKMNFPAFSYFDIFFEVDVGGITLHNNDPFRMACQIEEVPPVLCFYLPPITGPIVLYDANETKIATLRHAVHIPLPPKETLIIFSNEQKITPTPATSTPTQGGPTATPTCVPGAGIPCPETPTPTHTPRPATPTNTATLTSTPTKPCGDVNDDGDVDSIDALLELQVEADLLDPDDLINPASADTDGDGDIGVRDALLTLQNVAGLLEELSC
jgi:hypothetical protein